MKPNLAVGEVVVHAGEQSWLLRPSFQNTQSLIDQGFDPVKMLSSIHSDLMSIENPMCRSGFSIFDAIEVIKAYGDNIPDEVTGCMAAGVTRQRLLYRPGAMHWEDVILIAHHLLRFALIGAPSKDQMKATREVGESKAFDPSQFIGLIVSQLSIPHTSAWDMTMVEFQRIWESKFPDREKKDKAQVKQPMSQDQMMSLRERALAAQARHREKAEN